MSKWYIIFLALAYLGSLKVAFGDMEKPNKCLPWNGGAGPCLTNCKTDWDCIGTQKCCSVGCGRMCQNPCSITCDGITCSRGTECTVTDGCAQCKPTSNSLEKPGLCFPFNRPLPQDTVPVAKNCKKNCYADADCSGAAKCCSIGCSNICQSVCSIVCDGVSCDEGKECKVVNGCAQCVPSSQEKPGKCTAWQANGPCITNCEKDYDCTGSRKCCSVGCGKICQDPCPTSCSQLPPCLSGKECQVVDGCAQCI